MVGLLFSAAAAQESMAKIGVFSGFGQSAFEDQDAAGYIPVGLQGLYQVAPGLFVGAEINISAVKFAWEFEADADGQTVKVGDQTVSQNVFGALAKYEFGQSSIKPLLRAGFGMYMGSGTQDPEPGHELWLDEYDESFKRALGFNVGGGATGCLGGTMYWLGEFVYHIVSRELDVEDAESGGTNNWAVQAGIGVGF